MTAPNHISARPAGPREHAAVDPLSWLVRKLAAPRDVLGLDLFRICAGATLALHFAEQLRSTWPLIEPAHGMPELVRLVPASVLPWLWALALVASVGLSLGRLPHACGAVLFACALVTARALGALAHLDDFIATWLAGWLTLLPRGSTIRLSRPHRDRLLSPRWVPGASATLLLVSTGWLFAERALWRANPPEHGLPLAVDLALAAVAWLALYPRAAWPALAFWMAGHAYLALSGRFGWSNLALFTTCALWLRGPVPPTPRESPAGTSTVDWKAGLGFSYLCVAALLGCSAKVMPRAHAASTRVLDLVGLLPPRAIGGPSVPPMPALELYDAQGALLERGLMGGGDRARLLESYLTSRPRQQARDERLTGRLEHLIADRMCRRFRDAPSPLNITQANGTHLPQDRPLVRFECDPSTPEARIIPLANYTGDLLAASSRGFAPPDAIPAWMDRASFVGSGECRLCHEAAYRAWQASPHARALSAADPDSVAAAANQGSRVAYVLGEGGQWQAYLTDEGDGLRLLPLAWFPREKRQRPVAELYPEIYDPALPKLTQRVRFDVAGCVECHTTQPYVRSTSANARFDWVEPAVGCEACHGPGRAHVERRRGAEPASDPYAVSAPLAGVRSDAACASCHGPSHADAAGSPGLPLSPWPAFSQSRCQKQGGATCTSCHSPHARSTGDKAALSPDRCTGCHGNLRAAVEQHAHSHHGALVTCFDCHMSKSPLRAVRTAGLRITDHAISLPRPGETGPTGTLSACAGCHDRESVAWEIAALQRWGASRALVERPWFALLYASQQAPHASKPAPGIVADALTDNRDDESVLAGLLRMLSTMRPEPRLVDDLSAFAGDARLSVRAAALGALARHDADRASEWLERGAHDEEPLVRLFSLRRLLDRRTMGEEEQRRYLNDLLRYSTTPPIDEFVRLARLREDAGDRADARALLELALRYAVPDQRAHFEAQLTRLGAHLVGSPGESQAAQTHAQ